MATGAITSTGIGSGVNASAIINQLISAESTPLNNLQRQASSINTQMSTMGKLQGFFSTMRDKANALVSPTLWTGTGATVSDDTKLKVSTGNGAAAGSYEIEVARLAASQTLVSGTFSGSDAVLGRGSLTIEFGSYDEANAFTPRSGGNALVIDVTKPNATLADIRDQINAAGGGVVAGIVRDSSGARLTLRSRETGAEQAFRLSASEATPDGNAATGLSALAYDAADAASPMARTGTAADAEATVNGIAVRSAKNTLTDVVEGLTITLTQKTTDPVSVSVAADKTVVKTAIQDFVTAFNEIAGFIRTETAYNADTKVAGSLQGDQPTLTLQSRLRGVINEGSSGSTSFNRLSDIGITMGTDGKLAINATKLDKALNNMDELRKLFAADGENTASSGFARRFKALADDALGSQGHFDARASSMRSALDRNGKAQDAQQLRLDAIRERLQRQYTALDTTMSRLNTLSNYVSQQMALLARS